MKKSFLVLVFFAVSFFCGCTTVENMTEAQRKIEKEKEMGEVMLDAFRKRDFDAFMQFTPAGSKKEYSRDKFMDEQRELISRMGEIVGYRFLAKLEFEPMHQYVWAVRFRSYSLKGDEIFKECLFVIVVGTVDEQRKVFLFGFK